jgi:hypothetical protein
MRRKVEVSTPRMTKIVFFMRADFSRSRILGMIWSSAKAHGMKAEEMVAASGKEYPKLTIIAADRRMAATQ